MFVLRIVCMIMSLRELIKKWCLKKKRSGVFQGAIVISGEIPKVKTVRIINKTNMIIR